MQEFDLESFLKQMESDETEEVVDDIELLTSYDEDVIASYMTNNYIAIKKDFTNGYTIFSFSCKNK